MTDVIDFLERLGQDATLRRVPLESALNESALSPDARAALASRDRQALEGLLAAANVCCLINAPVEEEHKDAPVEKDARAA